MRPCRSSAAQARVSRSILAAALLAAALVASCASRQSFVSGEAARSQVEATERAFAKTMADRDFAGFRSFLADEAIFFAGEQPLRGSVQVAEAWQRYFTGPQAPFSWVPDTTQVLESGTLALSSGPVFDPAGKQVGRFASIWRQEKPGVWRIVFDRGEAAQQ